MKARGIRGGILLTPESEDTPETIQDALVRHHSLLSGKVTVEVTGRLPWDWLELVRDGVTQAGGEMKELRPPTAVSPERGETVVVARTVRSGVRVESGASVVVLGDVNAGAEILANDDIIVLGTLRGLAHAGAGGNPKALIWAQEIRSPQLRIGTALAQAGGDGAGRPKGPEVAQLREGQIELRPWS